MAAGDELFEAIDAGDVERVRTLLEREPSLAGARAENGVSAILAARCQNQLDVVALPLAPDPPLDVFEAAALGRTERLATLTSTPRRSAPTPPTRSRRCSWPPSSASPTPSGCSSSGGRPRRRSGKRDEVRAIVNHRAIPSLGLILTATTSLSAGPGEAQAPRPEARRIHHHKAAQAA
jgi:hypothetical protein